MSENIRKTDSKMLTSFKTAGNPFYSNRFGLVLNNVGYWEKNVAMQFIVVLVGGSKVIFGGDEAKSVLYNLGDHDSGQFRALSQDEIHNLNLYLGGNGDVRLDSPIVLPPEGN